MLWQKPIDAKRAALRGTATPMCERFAIQRSNHLGHRWRT